MKPVLPEKLSPSQDARGLEQVMGVQVQRSVHTLGVCQVCKGKHTV